MRSIYVMILAAIVLPFFASCAKEEERKAVPPTSSASKMPWNRPQPGEGGAQFGGMLQKR